MKLTCSSCNPSAPVQLLPHALRECGSIRLLWNILLNKEAGRHQRASIDLVPFVLQEEKEQNIHCSA